MNCIHCADTGSLSKDLEGDLDCPYCDVAIERVALEDWAARTRLLYGSESSLWLIYQYGKAAAASQNQQTNRRRRRPERGAAG
jgi:hypothetical protein